ncbi:protein-lysine methyltransferase METTL21C-like isoform X2 [Solea solea]|uniref:protein-lysine methyltransferase METTL21C-like isoform X2 n=1 Tax=Solea solea TaxID=90069 RepID=UPI00272A8F7F|nr:protein-lysine methyltransferase METTL21C-like isoform X2 [Solea solea]
MNTLSTYFVEKVNYMRPKMKEEEEEGGDEDEGKYDSQIKELALQVTWPPSLLNKADEEDYHFVGQETVPKETLDGNVTLGDDEEEKAECDGEKEGDEACDSNCSSSTASAEEGQTQTVAWYPRVIFSLGKDIYNYVGHDIVIYEALDSFGAVMWPAALALCAFLENNREMVNLQGKEVLELGSGTGLVAIVASLLGASVTATDLPEVLSNLRANVMRNTRGRCRQLPQVTTLSWSFEMERTFPASVYRYDYVLAADVVYHHDFLKELLATMKHFCQPGTTVIWANRVRMESDLTFTENFKKTFHTSLLFEDGDMKIFMATYRGTETGER